MTCLKCGKEMKWHELAFRYEDIYVCEKCHILKEDTVYTKPTMDMYEKEKEAMSTFDKQVGGDHYQKFAIQPTVFLQANADMLGWCESNAIKYACRHKFKNGRQDIEKAIHYLEMILEKEYPEDARASGCIIEVVDFEEVDPAPPEFLEGLGKAEISCSQCEALGLSCDEYDERPCPTVGEVIDMETIQMRLKGGL